MLIANLDTDAGAQRRRPRARCALLEYFPDGLCTQEVAVLLAGNLAAVDRAGAEDALLELVACGARRRATPLGDDALWRAA